MKPRPRLAWLEACLIAMLLASAHYLDDTTPPQGRPQPTSPTPPQPAQP